MMRAKYNSNEELMDNLLELIISLRSKRELFGFLESILTPSELEQLPIRLEIVKRLKRGTPQREIAEKLGVGIATVTRGAREIQNNRFTMIS